MIATLGRRRLVVKNSSFEQFVFAKNWMYMMNGIVF